MRPCTISISDKGLITVSGVSNMKQFTISVDNKCIGITEESTYKLSTEIGKKVTVYIVAIDEDMNIYKSNEQDYTATGLFLYTGNAVVSGTVEGFTLTPDGNSEFPNTEQSIYAYRKEGPYGAWSISTNKKIDLTGYTKICCSYSTSSELKASGEYSAILLSDNLYANRDAASHESLTKSNYFEYGANNSTIKWTIPSSAENKSYYIGIGAGGQKDTYIHAIWLE